MTSKRIISSVLALAMTTSMMPTNLMAVAGDPPATVSINPGTDEAKTGTGSMRITLSTKGITKGIATNPSGKSYDFTVPTAAAVGSKIKPTLTTALDTGYEIKKITVKDENQNDVSAAVQADAEGFIMPDYNVTVDVEFGMIDYTITKNTATNGTVTVKNGENEVTTAHYGDTVTLVATPNDGYALNSIRYKKSGGLMTELDGSGNTRTFTMPADNVTVSAEFREKKNTGVTLNTTGTGGTASLMKNDYSELKSTDQVTEGDTFILCVNKEDGYSYRTSSDAGAVSMTEFTENEYQAYIAYANENGISIPINTVLYHVTMPYVASGDLNVNVEFAKAQTFTILYQPSTQPTPDVWCKFSKTENSQEKTFTVKMDPDAKMGSNTVYAVKLSAPFNPEKVAFGTSEEALETADMNTASVSQAETWTTITGGQYLIVGGNAKTAIVSFNHDDSSEYQIVICKTDDSGNVTEAGKVTTPAAPTKEGYNFVAWRGYEGIEEVNHSADTEISVKESMVFTAVWKRNNPNIKLNLNGGTGGSNVTSVAYGQALTISDNPTRNGYAFDGWTVAKTVTEDGKLFVKGTPFDLSTNITADLELDAQWKHEHSYSCYQISQFPSLKKYQKYESAVHIAVCGCEDVELVAHEFDSNGKCACGYQIPTSDDAELEVSYGKMESGNYTAKMTELPEKKKKNQEVSVSAPSNWGSLTFSKWQYSTDGGTTWEDAGAYTMMSFAIPCNMKMRAVYVNATTKPEVSMSATTYATTAANRDELYNSILYQMNYKLPDGYTYVDSGVRAGDNAGISYYELKEKRASMDGEAKAITYGIAAAMSFLQGELTTFDTSASWQYYAKRENNVLDENDMNAEKLGEYMYLSKPINIKDEPLYWNYKPNTKSQSGSINALIPVGFAQRNNGDHYIYAIAWLRYKDTNGNIQTIYTNALPTTLNEIASCGTVSKNGN